MSNHSHRKMKAIRWEGKPFHVSVEEIAIPKITNQLDAIVRLTSASICGTDLHTYRGRIAMEHPLTFGHENIGIVESVGSDVNTVKKGDRVVVTCSFAKEEDNGQVVDVGFYGVGTVHPLDGGQAEYMRIPFANSSLLVVPSGRQYELDYLLLADIWPTAWWALECAGQVLGDTVAVFGAGPVGLLCAYSAILRGATRVYVVDRVPARLAKAKGIGTIPINFEKVDPVAEIMKHEPLGVDRSCDCVGFECVDAEGNNDEKVIINWAANVTKGYGGIGVIGVYLPEGVEVSSRIPVCGRVLTRGAAGEKTRDIQKESLIYPIGVLWVKGISVKGGMVQPRRFQELLKNLIESGKAKPSFVFDGVYGVEEGEKAYRDFEQHKIIKGVITFGKREKDEFEKIVFNGKNTNGAERHSPRGKRRRASPY